MVLYFFMDKANEITKTNEGIKTNENFKLLSKLETLVSYINNVLVNYPKYM